MESKNNFDDEVEIDLRELFLELVSHWFIIFLVTFFCAGIAYGVSRYVMVPKYESTAQLYVLSKSTSITSLADIQMGTSLTNDYMVVVKGRPVLEQVIANLGLQETYGSLREKVTLNNPTNSRILEITVQHVNPMVAKAIADEIARVGADFIAAKMDQDPPNIIQSGYADGHAVSPKIAKNTLIGGFAGAVLACGIIVISYLFNDTIMVAEDVEKKLGLNVLGILPLEETEDDGERKTKGKMSAIKSKRK